MGKKIPFGQHFLNKGAIIDAIVEQAGLTKADTVLEIGPGEGALTKALAREAGRVVALEIDKRLIPTLKKNISGFDNVEVIQGDALSYDFAQIGVERFKVVSNLPYNISLPITKKLIDERDKIIDMVLMYQLEVTKRLSAKAGDDGYGALSILVQYWADTSHLLFVGKENFTPPPKVDSAVIRMTPRKSPAVKVKDEEFFFRLVKGLFAHRRKTIKNNLVSMSIDNEKIASSLEGCGISPSQRGEELSMEQMALLADQLIT
ncbi:MAG: 16S rRNA (adenine(1518)-N(6)/adenine(1519)-N(6))-dimethyltransferase RsmA [Nitrospinota bacterium]|nr:ribosomal RNA small subunit methyltransferase A [Nitrospinota bacterium]